MATTRCVMCGTTVQYHYRTYCADCRAKRNEDFEGNTKYGRGIVAAEQTKRAKKVKVTLAPVRGASH